MLGALLITMTVAVPPQLEKDLVAKYGEAERPRIRRGIEQVQKFWRAEDGDAAAQEAFIRTHFVGDPQALDALFNRMQFLLESLDGHMYEINRDWRWQADLDLGPVLPFDEITAGFDPSAHVNDDLFQNKLAFVVLLNFPLTTLEERLANGEKWSRRHWAEVNLARRFSRRIPAEASQALARARGAAEQYVATYNIFMGSLIDDNRKKLFPSDLRLLVHWNLRDEIKANYSLDPKVGLPKQRMIQRVMERIVEQTIPKEVIDNPKVEWNPYRSNLPPEPNTRYASILDLFRAEQLIDKHSPTAPTLIARRFNEDRQIPEERVRAMFERVLSSPLVPRVAQLIQKRLGRPLEPFDIWYNGFRDRGQYTETQLDEIVRKRYPNAAAYKRDMPTLLAKLGFPTERAEYLARNIEVDPARGSGHAWPAARRGDNPRLRTRIGPSGMDYKGFNIAVHEMGHNVEQVFSLKDIDYYTLSGVPNTAFTEALAFVFQAKDLELLGLAQPTAQSRALQTLNDFWGTYEIAGVALVDMAMWHWMYDHPDATPAQLKDAVVTISKDIWNRYYAPVFNRRDVTLLGIYQHMVGNELYLPDYPIGHLIAHQVEERMEKAGTIGPEFERISKMGSVTPDYWMKNATGAPVGPGALLTATEAALKNVEP